MIIKGFRMNELTVVDKATEWRRMKGLVLDSVRSPITKRVYNMALDESPQLVNLNEPHWKVLYIVMYKRASCQYPDLHVS